MQKLCCYVAGSNLHCSWSVQGSELEVRGPLSSEEVLMIFTEGLRWSELEHCRRDYRNNKHVVDVSG